ncbi:glucose-6-phosphate isomerase [Paradevosia shaoguanensis]|uniref:Glucose-6-phosphate isomerase n=1 Tax=Paradevosia shaoguanensis TaxID=1335043 RepID=A0AA41QM03_9HYPH|nr:glucose-6-phosphate isomerase [Paradevosia shaoguanensis]MCF1742425.1 glucose-6-phosphate isomerase [Paradevosia shaoguanensis]MCI0126908.1 glucose-6-phosphate isomerase [Paradevosia shaoguanensis]
MAKSGRKAAFAALETHKKRLNKTPMRELFAADPSRFGKFSAKAGDILLDYSKNRIDAEVMAALFDFARQVDVEGRRDAMWGGEHINITEDRAVEHMALRYQGGKPVNVDGKDVMPDVRDVLARMRVFSDQVRDGTIRGATGEQFTDVINIGIGGSDLGPAMVTLALAPYTRQDLRVHYVSNVDGAHIHDTLKGLDPKRTMFIVASKTFTTDETMTNANTARKWIAEGVGEAGIADHFAALSTNLPACDAFGIKQDRIFGFWDWVGGRYSVWSAIGLPIAIAVGFENFEKFLKGAAAMDAHFLSTPLEENLPVIMGLIGVWYRNVWDFSTQAVLPYDQRLSRFAAYLQQQDMESNGKSVTLGGKSVDWSTGPIVWGEPGTNGQHAFYQLIHQGTDVIPCDFLIAANPQENLPPHHAKLVANVLAQSEALMLGKTEDEVVAELKAQGLDKARIKELTPHKVFPGNRPSNTIMYSQLTPETLGSLIALYEHKVFVQGTIWNVNSYDQWGVELGKQLAKALLPKVEGTASPEGHDSSTRGLLAYFHELKKQ